MTDVTTTDDTHADVESALHKLSLEEKVSLLTGHDFWSTVALPSIGLRSMVVSDGPSGVRGPVWDERSPSLNLPSASALSSSFDRDLARRYGAVAAVEARRKGVDVVLGPTINLHRSPRGGRHFEAFSEDPVLTAELAAAYVTGVQDNGVGATPKHYIANDSETDRLTVDVAVDDRALRELYLFAFEKAIVESRAWLVMSAYNSINGVTATENDLLENPLKDEWGFDGVVISDWTAVRSLASASAAQDLVMPGPHGPWGDALVAAVRAGSIPEATVDEKVRRLLRLAVRVGALGEHTPSPLIDTEDGPAFAREAAAAGMVLLENRDELPWAATALGSVAVLGGNAATARTQGGGSATVVPAYTVSPLDGLREALPEADVRYALGASTQIGLAGIPRSQMVNRTTGEEGLHVVFRDADGADLFSEDRFSSELFWFDGDAPIATTRQIEIEFRFLPDVTEKVEFGIAATGRGRVWIDDVLVIDEQLRAEGDDLGASLNSPATHTILLDTIAGQAMDVRFVYEPEVREDALAGALSLNVGTRPAPFDEDAAIAEAAALAARSDVALVVVGTNEKSESEGVDRENLYLPGRQNDLVRAVAAANPRTVVLVNSGAPVIMPWRNEVAGVLVGWFAGQEYGHAVADVLLGAAEPGGRLPTTWPAEEADSPVLETVPTDGVLAYSESIHVGYRAWLRAGRTPAYWFGHGLGYADIDVVSVSAPDSIVQGEDFEVQISATNNGDRAGKHVAVVFAEKPDSVVERPARWVAGFTTLHLASGETASAIIRIPARTFAYWDDDWSYETGVYDLHVGATPTSISHQVSVDLVASPVELA